MPRGQPYSWVRDHSNGPVIIEREPHVRTRRPARQRKEPIRLTFGFKFANPFKSRKRSVREVHQESHRGRQRADRPEIVEVREWEQGPRRSEESASMSRDPHRDEFVPLPPRIPVHHQGIHHQGPDPVIEILPTTPRRTPEVHQPRRNSFANEFPINHSPVRPYEPELVIERERDRRRNADRHARQETRRRREAEEEVERVRLAAAREREHRRRAQELAQQMERMAINERESRREAQEEARRLAAEAADAEARARQAEAALLVERRLAERVRAFHERQRQAEIEDRAEVEARNHRRRSVHIQQDLTPSMDRGAEVLRQAQEAERRRRESDTLFRIDRDRYRDTPRRQRSITLYDDDDDRWRYRRV
jgi:hypothetical protein